MVIWSNFAKQNLKFFKQFTKMNDQNTANYINSLIKYVNNLESQHYLGKVLYNFDNKEIRQIIFKSHKILYIIHKNNIYIISVIHTLQNSNIYIKFIEKFFK